MHSESFIVLSSNGKRATTVLWMDGLLNWPIPSHTPSEGDSPLSNGSDDGQELALLPTTFPSRNGNAFAATSGDGWLLMMMMMMPLVVPDGSRMDHQPIGRYLHTIVANAPYVDLHRLVHSHVLAIHSFGSLSVSPRGSECRQQ